MLNRILKHFVKVIYLFMACFPILPRFSTPNVYFNIFLQLI
jgi:hypothetical protein